MMTEQIQEKKIKLSEKTIKSAKENIEAESIDMVDSETFDKMKSQLSECFKDDVSLSRLFVTCYGLLQVNAHLVFGTDVAEVKEYLNEVYPEYHEIKRHVAEYGDGHKFGDTWRRQSIQRIVEKNSKKFEDVILVFFKVMGDSE